MRIHRQGVCFHPNNPGIDHISSFAVGLGCTEVRSRDKPRNNTRNQCTLSHQWKQCHPGGRQRRQWGKLLRIWGERNGCRRGIDYKQRPCLSRHFQCGSIPRHSPHRRAAKAPQPVRCSYPCKPPGRLCTRYTHFHQMKKRRSRRPLVG